MKGLVAILGAGLKALELVQRPKLQFFPLQGVGSRGSRISLLNK